MEDSRQEPTPESPSTPSVPVWVKPTLEVIGVSLECTAYAATREAEA